MRAGEVWIALALVLAALPNCGASDDDDDASSSAGSSGAGGGGSMSHHVCDDYCARAVQICT